MTIYAGKNTPDEAVIIIATIIVTDHSHQEWTTRIDRKRHENRREKAETNFVWVIEALNGIPSDHQMFFFFRICRTLDVCRMFTHFHNLCDDLFSLCEHILDLLDTREAPFAYYWKCLIDSLCHCVCVCASIVVINFKHRRKSKQLNCRTHSCSVVHSSDALVLD